MWPGFDSQTCRHMWVEFVVGSRPCSEDFSPGFPVVLTPPNSLFLFYSQLVPKEYLEQYAKMEILMDTKVGRSASLTPKVMLVVLVCLGVCV